MRLNYVNRRSKNAELWGCFNGVNIVLSALDFADTQYYKRQKASCSQVPSR